jgi:D-beta-D-heptose 7-phosphate kinase/D-beta-D-heptose 1-phosphate adenosyltransferase
VLVVGDIMLDHFVLGRVNRISPEAPVPVVEFTRDEYRLGGAANVAQNVRALGGATILAGVVGQDEAATRVVDAIERDGLGRGALVVDTARPTTRKMRVITDRRQQVARIDYESDHPLPADVEDALIRAIAATLPSVHAIVVSDYLKGVVSARLMQTLTSWAAEHGTPLLVDPKIPHLDLYRGAQLITPNHHEAEAATYMRIRTHEEARDAARAFRDRAGCASVLITRGEHGMWLLASGSGLRASAEASASGSGLQASAEASASGSGLRAPGSGPDASEVELALPAVAREVADVTGAGDTVVATMALAMAAGGSLVEAAVLANRAAGLAVAKFGPATISPEELLANWT